MSIKAQINPGEINILFSEPVSGKISFADMGLKDEDMVYKGGHLRIVFNFRNIGGSHFFRVPTIEVGYAEEMSETHWQCDFNQSTILDKNDHHGHSTIVLLNRKKLAELEHRHENQMVLHGEFPQGVHILSEKTRVQFF